MLNPIKITIKSHFCRKNVIFFFHYVRNVVTDVMAVPENL